MRKIIFVITVLISFHSNAQTPTLIFHSGFEPGTDTINHGAQFGYLTGTDLSLPAPNDWDDFNQDPIVGGFNLQYQGGNDTMRLAHIAPDPVDSTNSALKFWIKHPNAPSGAGFKSRIQANLSFNSGDGLTNLYQSVRLFLPQDLDTLKYYPDDISWFTLAEFWNNNSWTNNPYPFRVSVNLEKETASVDSLTFGVSGETYDTLNNTWVHNWDTSNVDFSVPIGKWMTIETNFIEGDSTSGRFYMAVTPDGEPKTVVFDLTRTTHHPSDPNPDGLKLYCPLKLYTWGYITDSLTSWGKLNHVYWDDFEIWKDSTASSGMDTSSANVMDEYQEITEFEIFPNPTSEKSTIRFNNLDQENYTLTVIDTRGEIIQEYLNLTGEEVLIETKNWPRGLYLLELSNGRSMRITRKLSVE